MQPDRCLHVCLLGDPGVGHSRFLRCFRHSGIDDGPDAQLESIVKIVSLDGEEWQVRLTDNLGADRCDAVRQAALSSAHLVLLCFGVDAPASLRSLQERWAPLLWAAGVEAPTLVVGMRADLRGPGAVTQELGRLWAGRLGAVSYDECSAADGAESVRQVVDRALAVAKEFYSSQWQLRSRRAAPGAAEGDGAEPLWQVHERLGAEADARPLTQEEVKKGLSVLGRTPTRQHAYLRCDLAGLGLTSLSALHGFQHLQFVNVSGNQLCSLEPLGALRCMLHLNASHNNLMRTQSFTPPHYLETVDMSYNMIGQVGDWSAHAYLRELSLRGNFITEIGQGLLENKELRVLDFSENNISTIEFLDGLGLRSLSIAHNKLETLDGVASLSALLNLDARHNMLTTIAALKPEDLPRLRKVCASDNRLTHILEVDGLASFEYLCDLELMPNPLAELPFYRSQVLHRLPRLRSLDAVAVMAEEKVKSEVIYGIDIEARREIFDGLLPKETFVDRRMMTEEGLAELEEEKFSKQGDAGPFGAQPPPSESERTPLQDARFRQRLAMARMGGQPPGVADFTDFGAPFVSVVISDEDLQEILEASLEGGVRRLLLGAAKLSPACLRHLVAAMSQPSASLLHVDLAGCEGISGMGKELLSSFPLARGCSMEAAGTGLAFDTVETLRNEGEAAERAEQEALLERQRTARLVDAYLLKQEALEALAGEMCSRDAPPPPPPPLCHPLKWRPGVVEVAEASLAACRAANPQGLSEEVLSMRAKDGREVTFTVDQLEAFYAMRDSMLTEWGYLQAEEFGDEEPAPPPEPRRPLPRAFAAAFDPVLESSALLCFMAWEGLDPAGDLTVKVRLPQEQWEADWNERQRRCRDLSDRTRSLYDSSPPAENVGSGQLVAHFTYLGLQGALPEGATAEPRALSSLGFRRVGAEPRPAPRRGEDLHEALQAGRVAVRDIAGVGFGRESLGIRLVNQTGEPLEIAIRQGTIFQHRDWQHRQNLLVAMDYVVLVPGDGDALKLLSTFCMNSSIASPHGAMELTELYFDDAAALASQGLVWDYFDRCLGGP